jgi:hypothetical protein
MLWVEVEDQSSAIGQAWRFGCHLRTQLLEITVEFSIVERVELHPDVIRFSLNAATQLKKRS